MNKELEDLIKGWKPKFGDPESISMRDRIISVRSLQKTVANHNSRVKSLQRAVDKKTESEKRLELAERNLIWSLKNANAK